MTDDSRVVVWFSCGAASAACAYHALQEYDASRVHVVYCDTFAEEHSDNKRFFNDVETWLGHPIEVITNDKYEDVEDVWRKRRYMAGISGAPCTAELKKVPRFQYQEPDDIHVFGLTADEQKRIDSFAHRNPELRLDWILARKSVTKEGCYHLIANAGIELPAMYQLGFRNNNCIGCVKASSPAYWDRVRHHFPETFQRRAELSREIGAKLVRVDGERMFLDELPYRDWNDYGEEDISCGPDCGQQELFQ